LADRVGANVILATDPDADRLGIRVRGSDGKFSVLTGNQIGCLLLEHILSSLPPAGTAAPEMRCRINPSSARTAGGRHLRALRRGQ
jgi:phosphomannomutase